MTLFPLAKAIEYPKFMCFIPILVQGSVETLGGTNSLLQNDLDRVAHHNPH